MFLRFFLWLNSKFPEIPHPFNARGERSERSAGRPEGGQFYQGPLRYAEFEFEHAPKMCVLYEQTFQKGGKNFAEWIRGKTVADFCCGGGGKSLYFLTLGAERVMGFDMNPIFIEQARQLALQKNLSGRAEFRQENVCATSLADASVDLVVFNDAIDHIGQPEKALHEALRVLRPGGFILINFESYYFPWGHHLLDAIRIPWIHLFTAESFRIKLYKALVEKFPDAKERLQFRLGHDEHGRERITYLNRLTIRKFQKILKKFTTPIAAARSHRSLATVSFHKIPLRRKILQLLGKIPFINEFFLSTHLWVLEKVSAKVSKKTAENLTT